LVVSFGDRRVTAVCYEASEPRIGARLILAHGAGAGQHSAFMTDFSMRLAALGLETVTFNFPYIEEGRKLPDRAPILEACYRAVVDTISSELARSSVLVGGKSMGGRIATHIAAANRNLPISGLVLLGYPLHPPGRPKERRDAHLAAVGRPMFFVQGARDSFGTPEELRPVLARLAPPATLHVVDRGDHSFKIPRAAAGEQEALYAGIQSAIVGWVKRTMAHPAGAR
jgi:predicted alpha/beta-hydrolase family hydrolase